MTESPTGSHLLLTRRRLVQAGGAAAAALYLGRLTGSASASGVPSYLSRSSYAALTNTPFTAVSASGTITTLRLTEVADLVRARHEPAFAGRDDAFALAFRGPRDVVLDAGIHALRHPSFGEFSLFIAPVDNVANEQRYEVVVDRSVRVASAVGEAPQPMERSNAAATVAPAAAAATGGDPGKKAKAKIKLVQSARVVRRGDVLTSDVRVAAGRGIVSVRATLLRDGVEYARAGRLLRGRVGVRLTLRELRVTAPGTYDLRVTVTDRHGKRTKSLRSVTVR